MQAFGVRGGINPPDDPAPVVPDEMELLDLQRPGHLVDITGELLERVIRDLAGPGAGAVAALVVGDHLETLVEKRAGDFLPAARKLRPAVYEHDRRGAVRGGRRPRPESVEREAARLDAEHLAAEPLCHRGVVVRKADGAGSVGGVRGIAHVFKITLFL